MSFELSLYSWIDGLDDDIQWSELFLLRVQSVSAFMHERLGAWLYRVPIITKGIYNRTFFMECSQTWEMP